MQPTGQVMFGKAAINNQWPILLPLFVSDNGIHFELSN